MTKKSARFLLKQEKAGAKRWSLLMHDAAVAGIVLAVRRFPVRDAAGHFEDLERDHQPQTDIRIVEIQRENVLDLLNAVDDAVAVHCTCLAVREILRSEHRK